MSYEEAYGAIQRVMRGRAGRREASSRRRAAEGEARRLRHGFKKRVWRTVLLPPRLGEEAHTVLQLRMAPPIAEGAGAAAELEICIQAVDPSYAKVEVEVDEWELDEEVGGEAAG